MGVAVDQAGHADHAGAVDDLGGLLGRSLLADVNDLAVRNADVTAKDHIQIFIHGHDCDVGN